MDWVHLSRKGSCLSTCVFYVIIFQQSPEGLTYMAGLSEEIAQGLQAIAENCLGELRESI